MKTSRSIRFLILLIALHGYSFAQDETETPTPEPVLLGPARLDLNTRAGDQSQRQTYTTPAPSSTITIDVAAAEGANGKSGFDLHLSYDPDRLAFQTAQPVDLFEGAFLLPSLEPGSISLVGLLLDSDAPQVAGSIAHITFSVLDSLNESTQISLDHLILGTALQIDSLQTGTQSSVVTIGGDRETETLDKPDFDGDGSVGFLDFIIFAGGFGSKTGDQSFNPILDLNADGEVGFSDFLVFAQAFGT
jgi:hypothetical protein